jgi:hypothetical protein
MKTKEQVLQEAFGHAYGGLHPIMHLAPMENALEIYGREVAEYNLKAQFREMMQENPVKMLQFFLTLIGKEIVAANAGTFELSAEIDIDGQRYKVSSKAKAKKVRANHSPTPNP